MARLTIAEIAVNLFLFVLGFFAIYANEAAAKDALEFQSRTAEKFGVTLNPRISSLSIFKIGFIVAGILSMIRAVLNLIS